MSHKLTFLALLFSLTAGCSWRMAPSLDNSATRTISIPYVQGDSSGKLTNELVEQIERQGGFHFVQDGGDLTLKVKLVADKYENIGFRYDLKKFEVDRHRHGKRRIIPNETRSKLVAEVQVVDNSTGKNVLGPVYILGTAEYDHQNYSINNDINRFSLGQLSDIDTAHDVLDIPLHRNLAREIAQYLVRCS